jgi:hypothetical protein
MNRFRRLAIAAGLSLAVVSVPAISLATTPTNVTYAISGFEYGATPTVGSFAGFAVAADDYGPWQATIVHTSLSSGTATITAAGSFALYGKVRHLAGTFANGSITQTGGFTGCGQQTYSVIGHLILAAGAGAADFGAVLTHYRIWLWGQCITYAATVKGSVIFSLN